MSEIETRANPERAGLDLGAALRLLLGLAPEAEDQAVIARVRARVIEDAVDRAIEERPVLATLSNVERRAAARKNAREGARDAALERAYRSQGLSVEKDALGRIQTVTRRDATRK